METKDLSRLQPCSVFKIRSPRWMGSSKKRAVGLDITRITKHNEIQFTYTRVSDGELSMPDHYYFDGDLVKQLDFEKQVVGGTTLIIVPISDLKILRRV